MTDLSLFAFFIFAGVFIAASICMKAIWKLIPATSKVVQERRRTILYIDLVSKIFGFAFLLMGMYFHTDKNYPIYSFIIVFSFSFFLTLLLFILARYSLMR